MGFASSLAKRCFCQPSTNVGVVAVVGNVASRFKSPKSPNIGGFGPLSFKNVGNVVCACGHRSISLSLLYKISSGRLFFLFVSRFFIRARIRQLRHSAESVDTTDRLEPQLRESPRTHCGVGHGVLNVRVPQVLLRRSNIDALVNHVVAASMA